MLDILIPLLLAVSLVLGAVGAMRRIAMWRRGRPSPVNVWQGLASIPRRYLVDLHHVVERDKYIAHTHVATAGGFVASMILAIIVHGFDLAGGILGWLLLAFTAIMFVGSVLIQRRRINPPDRLSKGPFQRLPKSLMAFSIGMFLTTLPAVGLMPEERSHHDL